MTVAWYLTVLAMASRSAGAQSTTTNTTETITAVELRRHASVLAADSMRERTVLSPALERAARYVAAQLQQAGVQPWDGFHKTRDWFQRYPVPGRLHLDYATTAITFTTVAGTNDKRSDDGQLIGTKVNMAASFRTSVRLVPEVGPQTLVERQPIDRFGGGGSACVVLIAGRQTADAFRAVDLRDCVVLYVPPPRTTPVPAAADSAAQLAMLRQLYAASSGVVVLSADDSAHFATAAAARLVTVPVIDNYLQDARGLRHWSWVAEVWPPAIDSFLVATGIDLARLRADSTPILRDLPTTAIWLEPGVGTAPADSATAPNVVGLLPGTDSTLKDQYIMVTAGMDVGNARRTGDSLLRGQDMEESNAGIAGLLILAKALSRPETRPKRPILFLVTSGAAAGHDSWGRNAYLMTAETHRVDVSGLIAAITFDGLGARAGDTVWVNGGGEVDLASPIGWMAVAHSELGLTVVDSATVILPEEDPWTFVRHRIPSLSVRTHRRASPRMAIREEDPPMVDLAHEARVLRFMSYVIQTMANAPTIPRWTSEARRRFADLRQP